MIDIPKPVYIKEVLFELDNNIYLAEYTGNCLDHYGRYCILEYCQDGNTHTALKYIWEQNTFVPSKYYQLYREHQDKIEQVLVLSD